MGQVASFTDAWIETPLVFLWCIPATVASFTDAWIETTQKIISICANESHLLQMRGLKLVWKVGGMLLLLSHLLQMRGLKLQVGK